MMQGEILISIEDLEDVRQALMAAHSYVNAIDLAESQKRMDPTSRESSLAAVIREGAQLVQGHLDSYLRARYEAGDFDEVGDDAGE